MNLFLKPEFEQFVNQQIAVGHFSSPADVVEAALRLLQSTGSEGDDGLDEETLDAIQEADEQFARGEGRPWEEVRAELQAKYLGR